MKGIIIDCKYIVRVKDLMKFNKLPKPRKRLLDSDGSILPVILVETEI